ncbi:MAG: hypothetical protein ACK5AZ_04960 [Bryobacteraceae bacterium]
MKTKIEKISYQGWPNCYRLANGEVELVVTGDIGPRIMRYAFAGGRNLFKEFPESLGRSGEAEWQLRGGHRLWVGPEDVRYTYAPDNDPVEVEICDGALRATQPVEPLTRLRKQIEVRLAPQGTEVEVRHRITNTNVFTMEFAAWTPTMMAQGGVGITGFPPRGTHPECLQPTNPLVMWAFTDLSDPRWRFTKKYLTLRQDPDNPVPQKLGMFNRDTWGAYLLGDELFLKRYAADPAKTYPEFNASFEIFTNADMLELETLGPMTHVEAGGSLEHVERWSLHRGIEIAEWTDEAIDRAVLPLLG